ncbi:hypothetical protein CPS_3382 [Colwellia psychrerythraea 34H]|uniref:Uncharacterized protein n=1 Tax=Colwellia psychrerythraea (strain 34H / ATCC BAA-681) TaxID=167879 RepID=Q47YR2_COLP3|nr:hypothetical protein CPS_3382 [Colwellia psychrerythraea 34H]
MRGILKNLQLNVDKTIALELKYLSTSSYQKVNFYWQPKLPLLIIRHAYAVLLLCPQSIPLSCLS